MCLSDSEEELRKKILARKRREAERQKPSPGSMAIHSNRLSFFDNPTEPVRIDPWSFLGLPSKHPVAQSSPRDDRQEEDEAEPDDKKKKVKRFQEYIMLLQQIDLIYTTGV